MASAMIVHNAQFLVNARFLLAFLNNIHATKDGRIPWAVLEYFPGTRTMDRAL
jgi:hypothetical protein